LKGICISSEGLGVLEGVGISVRGHSNQHACGAGFFSNWMHSIEAGDRVGRLAFVRKF
jgi:hypothetical protein